MGEMMRYAECYLHDVTQRDAILAWLRGAGTVVFSTEPDRYCKATILEQIEFVEEAPGNTLIVAFACQPYRYAYPEPAPLLFSAPGSITNPGTADAEPVIIVEGSGDIALTIGAKTVQIGALSGSITMDTSYGDTGAVFQTGHPEIPMFGSVSSDNWPLTIPPGANAVSWTGTVTSVTITRPWRYI